MGCVISRERLLRQKNHSNCAMPTHPGSGEAWQRPTKTDRSWDEDAMNTRGAPEAIGDEGPHVHDWRTAQLERLGIPRGLAEAYADRLDWHQVAKLVQRGCPPLLALRIIL
jgi:hypothetical protein